MYHLMSKLVIEWTNDIRGSDWEKIFERKNIEMKLLDAG